MELQIEKVLSFYEKQITELNRKNMLLHFELEHKDNEIFSLKEQILELSSIINKNDNTKE